MMYEFAQQQLKHFLMLNKTTDTNTFTGYAQPLQPRPGGYTLDGQPGLGSQSVPGYVGLSSGPIARGYSPLEDPTLLRREATIGIKPGLTDIEHREPFRKSEGLLVDESNILFVDGLPRDCTRREVARILVCHFVCIFFTLLITSVSGIIF